MYEYHIEHTSGGYKVEWYREHGLNAQIACWFGSLEECVERAKYKPDPSWWQTMPIDLRPDRTDPGYWKDNF